MPTFNVTPVAVKDFLGRLNHPEQIALAMYRHPTGRVLLRRAVGLPDYVDWLERFTSAVKMWFVPWLFRANAEQMARVVEASPQAMKLVRELLHVEEPAS